MRCPKCNNDISINDSFCERCGQKLHLKNNNNQSANKRLLLYFSLSYFLYLIVVLMTKRGQFEKWSLFEYIWNPITEIFLWILIICLVLGIYNLIRYKKFIKTSFMDTLANSYKIMTFFWIALLVFFFVRYVVF